MRSRPSCLLALLVSICQTASCTQLLAQGNFQPPVQMPRVLPAQPSEMFAGSSMPGPGFVENSTTSNQMLWQQYQALQMGEPNGTSCSSCGASSHDRCGCNTEIFPWIGGPGSFDQWCVGPKWDIDAGGLVMVRDDADWNRVVAAVGGAPTLEEQFDLGPGGRIFVTGYSDAGYGIQIGYQGINDWDANLAFDPGGGVTQNFNYQSRLNSVEINFLPQVASPWKLYSGFRYVQLVEDFLDSTTVTKITPAPATPAGIDQFDDLGFNSLIKNRLFGLQLGGSRKRWQFGNRLTLQANANAGVYINKFRSDDVDLTITTTLTGDDTATATEIEFTETATTSQTSTRRDHNDIAFVGEAGFAAAWRLNPTTALRAGYQILALDGVGTALEASFAPGFSDETILFHGLQFGLEYRR